MTKDQYLAEVARLLDTPPLVGTERRRALWFFLCCWSPHGAAIQIRCERENAMVAA